MEAAATHGALDDAAAELVLRYLKHRWGPALPQLHPPGAGPEATRLQDLDLDADALELERAVGWAAVERVGAALLALTAPPPADAPARRALAPEVTGAAADALLGLVGVNLAFRVRTDALLAGLVVAAGARTAPRPTPELVGRLLGRARSARAARALIEGAAAPAEVRAAVAAALVVPAPPGRGARLHVEASPEVVERALGTALRPRKAVRWSAAGPAARRLLCLRRRGTWTTVLAEGDDLELELAQAVARQAGVRRTAWARFGAGLDLRVWEGARTALDLAALAARGAGEPDDVAGALRALGVFDLDPDHPRGETALLFVEHLGGGPPLGLERRLRQAGHRPVAFE